MSKNDVAKARAPKIKMLATRNKKTANRIAKFKLSNWYESAARSVAIANTRSLERQN